MNKILSIPILVIITLFVGSCQNKDKKNTSIEVRHSGALRTIMSGDIQPVLSLDTLSSKKYLYALGAVENLKGEIQIFNNKPSNSFVSDSSLQIKETYNLKASLLVYAEVKEWESFKVENIETKKDLESRIFEIAKSNGFNTDEPFPFLLEGKISSLDWHVINWKKGDKIHSHQKHIESGLNGTLKDKEVQVIGFYSNKHKAIFTHHTTNIHMHFKTNDNVIAGHIDDLLLKDVITLKLSKQ